MVRLKPPPGHQYRDTDTKQLIDPVHGADFDPCDLDVVRALECGDLVTPQPRRTSAKPKKV